MTEHKNLQHMRHKHRASLLLSILHRIGKNIEMSANCKFPESFLMAQMICVNCDEFMMTSVLFMVATEM